jgi:hypothetical protein
LLRTDQLDAISDGIVNVAALDTGNVGGSVISMPAVRNRSTAA